MYRKKRKREDEKNIKYMSIFMGAGATMVTLVEDRETSNS